MATAGCPAARTAAVDLNTIPAALIDRVETVTGGAAAIYGADAVTGAVNVVMKKRMDGAAVSATTGLSEEGDARQTNFSLATGFDLRDNAHLVVGANYTYTDPLLVIDRYTERRAYNVNPRNTSASDGIPDNIIIDYHQFYRSNVPTFCIYRGASSCASGVRDGDWYQLVNGEVRNIPRDSYTVMTGGDTGVQDGGDSVGFGIFDNLYLTAYLHAAKRPERDSPQSSLLQLARAARNPRSRRLQLRRRTHRCTDRSSGLEWFRALRRGE